MRRWLFYIVIGIWSYVTTGMSTGGADLLLLLGFSCVSGVVVFLLQYDAQIARRFGEGVQRTLGDESTLFIVTPPLLLLAGLVLLWLVLRWSQPSHVLRMLLAGGTFICVQWVAGAATTLMVRRSIRA